MNTWVAIWIGFGIVIAGVAVQAGLQELALQVKRLVDLYDPQPTEDEER